MQPVPQMPLSACQLLQEGTAAELLVCSCSIRLLASCCTPRRSMAEACVKGSTW